jgi:hypothetical protein
MANNGITPQEDRRISSSPQHGILFGEAGVPMYRVAAVEYYVQRKKRLYEAVLAMPRAWMIALFTLVISLCAAAFCMLRESSVTTPALLVSSPVSSSSVPHFQNTLLVLPAESHAYRALGVGQPVKCNIDGKLQTVRITSIGPPENSEAASRQLHVAPEQTRSIANIVTIVNTVGWPAAQLSTKQISVIHHVRLIDLIK